MRQQEIQVARLYEKIREMGEFAMFDANTIHLNSETHTSGNVIGDVKAENRKKMVKVARDDSDCTDSEDAECEVVQKKEPGFGMTEGEMLKRWEADSKAPWLLVKRYSNINMIVLNDTDYNPDMALPQIKLISQYIIHTIRQINQSDFELI